MKEQTTHSKLPYGIVWAAITSLPVISLFVELFFFKRLALSLYEFDITLPKITHYILNIFEVIQANNTIVLLGAFLLVSSGYLAGEKLRSSQRSEIERIFLTLLFFGLVDVLTPIAMWILFFIPLFSLRGSF